MKVAESDGRLVKVIVRVEPDGWIPEDEGGWRLLPEGGGLAEGLDVRPTAEIKVAKAGGDLIEGRGRETGKATVTLVLEVIVLLVAGIVVVADVIVIVVTPLGIAVAAPFRVILKGF